MYRVQIVAHPKFYRKQNLILAVSLGLEKNSYRICLGTRVCMEGDHMYFAHIPSLITELKEVKNNRTLQLLKKKI